jgi:flagellar biogenesis protein FliO
MKKKYGAWFDWYKMFILTCTVLTVVLLLAFALARLTNGCSPGPKPAAWTHHEYVMYAATACSNTP